MVASSTKTRRDVMMNTGNLLGQILQLTPWALFLMGRCRGRVYSVYLVGFLAATLLDGSCIKFVSTRIEKSNLTRNLARHPRETETINDIDTRSASQLRVVRTEGISLGEKKQPKLLKIVKSASFIWYRDISLFANLFSSGGYERNEKQQKRRKTEGKRASD